jgi:hypothetical protein
MSPYPARIRSIDSLKGWGVTALVFLHCAVYYYGSLDSIDIRNPPFYVAVLGLMVLWGGLFGMASGLVNTYRFDRRFRKEEPTSARNPARRLFFVGLALFLLHLVYASFAAPTSLDFETHNHQFALIAQLLRYGTFHLSPRRIIQGTALQMLGINLMLLAALLPTMARRKRPVLAACILGVMFIGAGLIRIVLFPTYEHLLETRQYVWAFLISPITSEPYPVLPYFGFSCAGAAMGFSFSRDGHAPRFGWLVGSVILGLGIAGLMVFPTNLHGAGMFWFAKVVFELGVFTLLAWTLLALARFGSAGPALIRKVARMSLTVFVLQTPLSELFAALLTRLIPGWNVTLGVTLLFAFGNTLLWLGLVALWSRARYRYTIEYFWVRLFPGSTKLDEAEDP